LENADVKCNKLIRISDAKDFTFKNVGIQSADAAISFLDARNVTFDNVSFRVPGNEIITKLQGDATASLRFLNCTPEKPKGWETPTRRNNSCTSSGALQLLPLNGLTNQSPHFFRAFAQ
jgi:hypothetical protein